MLIWPLGCDMQPKAKAYVSGLSGKGIAIGGIGGDWMKRPFSLHTLHMLLEEV
jgi:hypothetical protein